MGYDHLGIEARWQRYWQEHATFATQRRPGRPKYYVLGTFSQPTGEGLHVGHHAGHTAIDIVARAKRMQGFDVLHSMGWDAFGLPAEQQAIQSGVQPSQTIQQKVATFHRQLQTLGFSYDVLREVDPTDPEQLKWTQWIFLQLFKAGLAFQSEITVNWCPGLGTALADEDVVDGVSERGGFAVVRQALRQWQLRIDGYADRSNSGLTGLELVPIYFPVATRGDPRSGAEYTIDYDSPIAVDESQLPLLLPAHEDTASTAELQAALAQDWRFFYKQGRWFARETNTLPRWARSWCSFLRCLDPTNAEQAFSQEAYDAWMPVDLYVADCEHAALHVSYARFCHKALYDAGIVKHDEPFTRLVQQGLILGQRYRFYALLDEAGQVERAYAAGAKELAPGTKKGEWIEVRTGRKLEPRWLGSGAQFREGKPFHPVYGVELQIVNEKMGEARGNLVNLDLVGREFGADSLRLYQMFMGPLERTKAWQPGGIQGVRNFLDKVNKLTLHGVSDVALSEATAELLHRTVKKVTEDIDGLRFNTAVSQLMIFVNHLHTLHQPPRSALIPLLLCMSPFAPHLAEELWRRLGKRSSISQQAWPAWEERLCQDEVVELPVQINGKVRARVRLGRDAKVENARAAALKNETIQGYLQGKEPSKLIFVPGRMLNLIVD